MPGPKQIEIPRGTKFGRLTVIKEVEPHYTPKGVKCRRLLCKCRCGNKKTLLIVNLKQGVISCGCYKNEQSSIRQKAKKGIPQTHGMSYTSLYGVYSAMMDRCYNKKHPSFHNYGGRGIKVCSVWKNDREAFFKWAKTNGYSKDLEIDRRNNDKGYSPKNCRWVTKKSNARNRRTNHLITYKGKQMCIAEAVECFGVEGVDRRLVSIRVRRGWTVKRALTTIPATRRLDIA